MRKGYFKFMDMVVTGGGTLQKKRSLGWESVLEKGMHRNEKERLQDVAPKGCMHVSFVLIFQQGATGKWEARKG